MLRAPITRPLQHVRFTLRHYARVIKTTVPKKQKPTTDLKERDVEEKEDLADDFEKQIFKQGVKQVVKGPTYVRGMEFIPSGIRGANVSISGKIYDENPTEQILSFIERFRIANYLTSMSENESEKQVDITKYYHLFTRAFTHQSYGTGKVRSNHNLQFIGKYVVDMYTSDFVYEKYNDSPYSSMKHMSLCKALYVNQTRLSFVAKNFWKIDNAVRAEIWNEMSADKQDEILSGIVLSVAGVIYSISGPENAKRFIFEMILNDDPAPILHVCLSIQNHETFLNHLGHALFYCPLRRIIRKEDDGYECRIFESKRLLGFGKAEIQETAISLAVSNAIGTLVSIVPNF